MIKENNFTGMCVIDRYANAYQRVRKVDWRTKSQPGVPVIEQATSNVAIYVVTFGGRSHPRFYQSHFRRILRTGRQLSHHCISDTTASFARLVPSGNTNLAL
ncbi:hypothetical protein V1520DRAFT_343389, partial [Lipomyces starkeyi]